MVGQEFVNPGVGPVTQLGAVTLPRGSEITGGARFEEWDSSGPLASPTKDLGLVGLQADGRALAVIVRTVKPGNPPTVIVTSWTDFTIDASKELFVYFSPGECTIADGSNRQVFGVLELPPIPKARVLRAWTVDFEAERLTPASPATLSCTVPGG